MARHSEGHNDHYGSMENNFSNPDEASDYGGWGGFSTVAGHAEQATGAPALSTETKRQSYSNKLELMLTLVGYAVGLGNVWRFPYLCYTYGGGAFLIPYFCALLLLGLPLFILEMGLGQMLRQGTLGVWSKLGLPRLRGIGAAATVTTFLVSLYYNVILTWTVYYLGRTIEGIVDNGVLPWDDEKPGFVCPEAYLFVRTADADAGAGSFFDDATGLFDRARVSDFWCPAEGLPSASTPTPEGFTRLTVSPKRCPGAAAIRFFEKEALQMSSGLDELGGFNVPLLISYTIAWIIVYVCIFKGVASSGKVVYLTATLPYLVLVIFFVRAVTLPNALTGIQFYLEPDFSLLADSGVWVRAVTQIFFSLGVGFGSLIAFASYSKRKSDFARDAAIVSTINCGTSFFAGFVVFPVLGFLAQELAQVNPCFDSNSLTDLASVGLSGPGLAFIAFPIAVSQMPIGWLWALLFFLMLLCLGIDSEFAMVESVITVISDSEVGKGIPRPVLTLGVCVVSYVLGLIFVTRGGVYWVQLFDYYTCAVSLFFVAFMECLCLMWPRNNTWPKFRTQVKAWTGRELGRGFTISWRVVCPVLCGVLVCLSFSKLDLMDAKESVPYPEGSGFYPEWSIAVGWALALLPIVAFQAFLPCGGRPSVSLAAPVFGAGAGAAGASARASRGPEEEREDVAFEESHRQQTHEKWAGSDGRASGKVEDEAPSVSGSFAGDEVNQLDRLEINSSGLDPEDIDVKLKLQAKLDAAATEGEHESATMTPSPMKEPKDFDTPSHAPDQDLDGGARSSPSSSSSSPSSSSRRDEASTSDASDAQVIGKARDSGSSSSRSSRSREGGGARPPPRRRKTEDALPVYGFLCGVYLKRGLPPRE